MKALCFLIAFLTLSDIGFCNPFLPLLGGSITSCIFSVSDADTFSESFEGANSGYDNSGWTETIEGGTSDIDPDTTHPGTFSCSDKCAHSIKVVYDATNAAKSVSPTFTAKASAYVQFYIYIGAEGLSNGESIVLLSVRNSSDGAALVLDLYQTSDFLYLATRYWSGATIVNYGTLTNVVTGTWYRFAWIWYPAGTSDVYVDGVRQGSGFDADTRNLDTFHIGGSTAATETATFYLDSIKIDDDTMPGACP